DMVEHGGHGDMARGRGTELVVVDGPHEFGEPPGRRWEIDNRRHGGQSAMAAARPSQGRRRLPTTVPVRGDVLASDSCGTGHRAPGPARPPRPRSGATARLVG